ncbi:LptF/LptG family permease [Rhizobiales bacterium RZME27]|uniref:LptF/LptG family permease n=1 Tax=Endobacterium cereale TaxID=2663029 RepID=A0A6A8ACA5_9HYPH|nr:LptF/LptG family permease [Endobacterium cereale]MEB2846163.1 LptF/LptG family permease [Endobacterium cereale]MQY48374.1 LptF/LptG family permease [Endobacterium cereale]
MKLIEFYILRRTFQMFLATLLPILAIIWTIQVLGRINLVTDTGQSIGSFATLASFILPTIIPVVMPFALVIGITQTLNAMNNDSELPVIDAAGSPRSVLYKPVLLLATLTALFSFVITNFIEPPARVKAREMVAEAYADLLGSVIEEKTFRSIEKGLYVQISERHSGRILLGLFLVDYRDPNFEMIYYAREGSIDDAGTTLTMRNGEVHRKTPDGRVSVIKFVSYAFDLSSMAESTGRAPVYAGDRNLDFLLKPDPTDKHYMESPGNFHSELHRRLSDWIYPLSYALIALVIVGGARSHRRARLHPMVLALIIAFAMRWLGFSLTNLAKNTNANMWMIYAPAVVPGLFAIYLLLSQRQMKLPNAWNDAVANVYGKLSRRITAMRSKTGGA